MASLVLRLLRDEAGQDLLEYALLTAGIGLAGIAVWPSITAGVGAAYNRLDTQSQAIWRTPNPGGS